MKKLILSVIFLMNMISLSASDGFATGTGTEADPYIVASVTELNLVRNFLGTANSSKHFTLTTNLDLADQGTYGWLPIGDAINGFAGKFYGNGYKISGLLINRITTDCVGLFGYLDSSAILQNTGVGFGTGGIVTGKTYTGGLAGINYGTIDNCFATDVFVGTGDFVGGLVGSNHGIISNCHTLGTITGAGGSIIVGGLAGVNYNIINYSYVSGTVTGSVKNVGGFVGHNNSGTISNSYASGAIHGLAPVGGFAGDNYGTIIDSYASGAVNAADSVGGFTGGNYGNISYCYATGATNGSGGYVGGFSGISYAPISMSYATGATTATGSYAGGFVAVSHSAITNCYATGPTTSASYSGGLVGESFGAVSYCYSVGATVSAVPVGGLVAKNHDTVTNSYWNKETSGQATSDGSSNEDGKTTIQMKEQATFVAWDFANYWVIYADVNSGYPSFRSASAISENNLPEETRLFNNYPNPFNPTTTINYEIKSLNFAKLAVYNTKGELVKILTSGMHKAGVYGINFDGSELNSGVYFYRLEADGKNITNKMMIIK